MVLLFYVLHGSFHYYTLILFSLPLIGSSLLLKYPVFDLTQLQIKETTILLLFAAIIITIRSRYSKSSRIGSRLSIGLLATASLLLLHEPTVRRLYTSYNQIPPRVQIKNGTLQGIHLSEFKEDLFLGIPFASPPIGERRLRRPVPYQKAWNGIRDATERGVSCPGYGPLHEGLTLGEGI